MHIAINARVYHSQTDTAKHIDTQIYTLLVGPISLEHFHFDLGIQPQSVDRSSDHARICKEHRKRCKPFAWHVIGEELIRMFAVS